MSEERIVHTDSGDAGSAAVGASSLISTIVWAIVVLVLLGVGLYALHIYLHWF
jgi:diacylglycerol kinase